MEVLEDRKAMVYIKDVLKNMPSDWLRLTTHRLDIYEERLAKTQFLERFEALYAENNSDADALKELPTAYDYIRLGHPLSCLLEWLVADIYDVNPNQVISFSSNMTPLMAVLRKNLLENKATQICYTGTLSSNFDKDRIKKVYGYQFDMVQVGSELDVKTFDGSTVFLSEKENVSDFKLIDAIDFYINTNASYGSVLLVNGEKNETYTSEIQHVRRRETIAMTPANTLEVLTNLVEGSFVETRKSDVEADKNKVINLIQDITGANTRAVVASSGLSMQYALMMGLIDHSIDQYPGKAIKFVVPTNCYGGTNDQARRVAACNDNIEVVDLSVDGGSDMVESIDKVLEQIAEKDAVPFIIAEIPTNPRVEVPEMDKLRDVLTMKRQTSKGSEAIEPVFILDQTFCPNTSFLREGDILSTAKVIAYVSGSKFPSGGLCTAGYSISNERAGALMDDVERHLILCDNEATDLQYEILATQLPSMLTRIEGAYKNTRDFVNFIMDKLPSAKINFVSEELAKQGFTPSVFSLDLPTKGDTEEAKETYKRALNLKLINMMIETIPTESKFCVSYGQLKGCYWTIPATSTQGTTKEGDKDYIVRVALSGNMDLDKHKEVFQDFVDSI